MSRKKFSDLSLNLLFLSLLICIPYDSCWLHLQNVPGFGLLSIINLAPSKSEPPSHIQNLLSGFCASTHTFLQYNLNSSHEPLLVKILYGLWSLIELSPTVIAQCSYGCLSNSASQTPPSEEPLGLHSGWFFGLKQDIYMSQLPPSTGAYPNSPWFVRPLPLLFCYRHHISPPPSAAATHTLYSLCTVTRLSAFVGLPELECKLN